jgi:hypothetical protein
VRAVHTHTYSKRSPLFNKRALYSTGTHGGSLGGDREARREFSRRARDMQYDTIKGGGLHFKTFSLDRRDGATSVHTGHRPGGPSPADRVWVASPLFDMFL